MNKLLIVAVSAIAVTTLSACGGSGGNSSMDTAKASIKAEILKSEAAGSANSLKMTDAQAGCAASATVDSLGVAKLQSYGLLAADDKSTTKKLSDANLSTADATTVVNKIFQCVGDATLISQMKTAFESRLPASVTAAQKLCMEGKLTADAVKQVAIAALTHQTAAIAQLTTSVEACMLH